MTETSRTRADFAPLTSRYELLGELGDGGMGMVCKARDTETGAVVALKMLRPELAQNPEIAERFKNELLLARKVTHKNVCRIYDFARAGDAAYISMEFVEGETLRELVQRRGRIPADEALGIARQIGLGLAEAHDQGVVHRDLKPENVMVDVTGTVKVMDFAISRSTDNRTTMSVGWVGTPGYMSPEQAAGKTATPASDVYSIGLILYELLTGQPTFVAETQMGVAMKHLQEAPVPPRAIEPGIPPHVERIVLRTLEKKPEKRYANARELVEAIDGDSKPRGAGAPRSRRKLLIGVGVTAAAAAIAVAVVLSPHRAAPLVIPFSQATLSNGMRVVISEDHSAPTIAVAVTYHVGSRDEVPGKSGIAHLFEHLMFMGSQNVAKAEHAALLTDAGGTVNASTFEDRTVFWDAVPANQLNLPLFLEADRMRSLGIDDAKLDNARKVISEERRTYVDNAPFSRSQAAMLGLAYDKFAYKHSQFGSPEDVASISADDARAFFQSYYAPSNAVITIVGDIRADSALAAVKKYFETIPKRNAPAKSDASQPPRTAERRQIVEVPFAPVAQLDVGYLMPKPRTPDWYALSLIASILGEGESSRLNRSLVREGELASAVASNAGDNAGPPLLRIVTRVRQGKDPAQAEKQVLASIERLQREPVTPDELQKAKLQARRSLATSLESSITRALSLGAAAAVFDDPALVNGDEAARERVTADDVQRVAKQYLTAANRTVVLSIPAPGRAVAAAPPRESANPAPTSTSLGTTAEAHASAAPVSTSVLSLHLPRPVEISLDNGLTALVVEDHRLPRVTVNVSVKGAGPIYDSPDMPGMAMLTASMLRDGTTTRTAKQIAEQIERTGATIASGAGAGSVTSSVTAFGLSDNIDDWMPLVADVVRHPRFPSDELNARRSRTLAGLQQQHASSRFLADEQFYRSLYGSHPQGRLAPAPETLDRVTPTMLELWHREHYTPQHTLVAITGDISPGAARKLLTKLFGDWPKTTWTAESPPEPKEPATKAITLVDRAGSVQSTVMVGGLGIDRRSPDYPAMLVMNYVLGGTATVARLGYRLREQKGYAYDAQSTFSAATYRGPWRAVAEVRTAVTDPALQDILAEVKRMADEPVPADELERAKRALVASFAMTLEQSSQVLANWINWKRYGFSDDYWDTFPAKLSAVTAEEVQQAARKYLDLARAQIVVVGDGKELMPALQRLGPVTRLEPPK